MVKAKKAKWRIEENTREGFTRYSIRKYSMGVASVAVLSGFFFLSGISVQASEIVAPQLPKQEMVSNVNSPTSRNQTNTEASVTNKNLSNDIPKGINEVNEASIQSSTSKESEEVKKDNLKEENSNLNRSARRTRSVGDNPDERTTAETSSQPASSSQPSTSGQPETSEQPGNSQPGKYLGTKVTAYFDNNNNGKYDEGIDELISEKVIPPAENGANGAAGKDGRNGAELLSGIIAPTPEDGKNGDTYIDAVTGDVYKKNNGTWNKIGNLRGPQGEKGQKGDKGENGKDGRAPKIKVDDIVKSAESAGVSSRSGIRITVYDDKNNNDEFDEGDTVLNTKDVYNGTDGRNGVDGQTPKVKAVRDEAKKQTTLTFYIDKDGDGNYTEGTDTLVQTSIVKDGQDGATGAAGRDGKEVLNGKADPTPRDGKDGDTFVNTTTGDVFVKKNNTWEQAGNIKGPKGDKGENGKDGFTPEVTVTDNHDGTHTITITQPEGRPALTTTVKNGVDGQTPKVKAVRDEAKKQTTLTFYIDKDGDGNYTEGTDTLVQTSIVKDGQDGATGQAGRDGKSLITVKEGKETKVYQEDPTHPGQPLNPDRPLAVIRDGVDGKTPTVTAARKEEVDHKGVE
ncbi:YSIRK-type signal peptide-containing protein, partial [uncultured Granulicatella sp.]|uniref:collagen-flanked surface repeat-containing protein n=1 Tax=uncultured Granulicatella sp. TaxID=316089 RepID=UPI0028E993E3